MEISVYLKKHTKEIAALIEKYSYVEDVNVQEVILSIIENHLKKIRMCHLKISLNLLTNFLK